MLFGGLFGGVFDRVDYADNPVVPAAPKEPADHPHIHTPEFKNWFGHWDKEPHNASKVVHPETGKPLRVFHGTLAKDDIHAFSPSHIGSANAIPADASGYFFSDSSKVSDLYSNSNKWSGCSISLRTDRARKCLRSRRMPRRWKQSRRRGANQCLSDRVLIVLNNRVIQCGTNSSNPHGRSG